MTSSDSVRRNSGVSGAHGAGRLNFIIFVLLAIAIGYAGYLYVPVAYRASLYKVYMQDTVDKAAGMGRPPAWAESELKAAAVDYGVPPDAVYKVEKREGRIEANVHWTHTIEFPGYAYDYEFDHTVRSGGFFTK